MKIDLIDKKILSLLQTDARMSNAELAENVNLSPTPCLRRLRKLEDSGLIRHYTAVLDRKELGFSVSAYVFVNLEKNTKENGKTFETAISLLPEVIEDSLAHIRRGAEKAGRDFDVIDKTWFPWVSVGPTKEEAVDRIKHSLASGAKHLGRFTTEGKHIPTQFLDKIRDAKKRYRFDQHQMPGSDNVKMIEELGLVDYLADRFSISGTVDDCIRKIESAAEAGATHFWMSVHFPDKERFMREWGETVMERFRR